MNFKRACLCAAVIATVSSCHGMGGLPSPTPPSSPTASSIAHATASASLAPPTETLSLVTPPPQDVPLIVQRLTAPDGQWDAESSFEFLEGGAAFRVRLAVRNRDQSVEWVPVDYTQKGIGYIYPALRYWAPDSHHFYYFNMPTPDGCGDFYPVEDEWIALSVADGSLSTLTLPDGRGHTISPDGQTMVYATSSPPYGLIFRNILASTEQFLPLPPPKHDATEVQAGGSVWSPDGSSLALSVAYGDSCRDDPLSFSVVRIDNLPNPSLVPLVEGSHKLLRLVRWETSDRILVKDWDNDSWWIDTRGGLPVQAPETQRP